MSAFPIISGIFLHVRIRFCLDFFMALDPYRACLDQMIDLAFVVRFHSHGSPNTTSVV